MFPTIHSTVQLPTEPKTLLEKGATIIVIIRQYSFGRFLLPYNHADPPTKRRFLNCTII